MDKTFKHFQKQDEFITCEALLVRWKNVSQCTIVEATQADILIPFTYTTYVEGNTITEKLNKATLPTCFASICDNEGDALIDEIEASKKGIVFSLANILLLENKYPDIFANKENIAVEQTSNELSIAIYKEKQQLELEYEILYSKYCKLLDEKKEAEANRDLHFADLHNAKRYINRLQTWLKEARSTAPKECKDKQQCDGQAVCLWLCDRRRRGIPDSETATLLHERYGFTKPAAYYLVSTPKEFEEEQKAAKDGKPITNPTRQQRYDSIAETGSNKHRKERKQSD